MDSTALIHAIYAAFNTRDFDAALRHLAPDAEITNVPAGTTGIGRDAFRQFMQGWATAFPDAVAEVRNVVAAGDQVVAEFSGRGTHTGPFQTPMGTVPPTGRRVDVPFCDVWTLRDGQFTAARSYFDVATFMGQLGLMAEPAAEGADPREVARTIFDRFNGGDFDSVLDYIADDVEAVLVPFGQTFHGRDGFVAFMQGFKQAFPDLAITLTGQHTDGAHVTNEFTARGTHTGPLMTPAGEVPPTGRTVAFTVCEVWTVRDGKVTRLVNYQDSASLMRQLGLMPTPEGVAA